MSANDDTPSAVGQSQEVAAGKPSPAQSNLRWRAVLIVVLPLAALLAVGALAGPRLMDLDAFLNDMNRPALVAVGGQVIFDGQPLRGGIVMTQPVDGRGAAAIGWTDQEGRFSLKTDIRGTLSEGVTVGDHRVTVTEHENVSQPGGPPLITPKQYASMETSPLRMTVDRDPKANEFKFVLDGKRPPPSDRKMGGAGMSPPRPPGAGGGQGGGRGGRGGGKKGRGQATQDAPEVKSESSDATAEKSESSKSNTAPPEEK